VCNRVFRLVISSLSQVQACDLPEVKLPASTGKACTDPAFIHSRDIGENIPGLFHKLYRSFGVFSTGIITAYTGRIQGRLLADAKAREDLAQQVVGAEAAGDGFQGLVCFLQVLGNEFARLMYKQLFPCGLERFK
jgi:hypothetical protein